MLKSVLEFTICVLVGHGSQVAWAQHVQNKIVHDAEYYILEAQNAERWAAENEELEAKLAALRAKHGRPPNIVKLFPHSKALIVSGKVIDRAMITKGKAMTIAANGRNQLVIQGALLAAQKANAAIIIEIAKSEGGAGAYCAANYWNLARIVDSLCNELGITVPVAVHADHYGIKNDKDIEVCSSQCGT